MQNRLSKAKAGKLKYRKGLLIAASVAVVRRAIYYFSSGTDKAENNITPTVIGFQ